MVNGKDLESREGGRDLESREGGTDLELRGLSDEVAAACETRPGRGVFQTKLRDRRLEIADEVIVRAWASPPPPPPPLRRPRTA